MRRIHEAPSFGALVVCASIGAASPANAQSAPPAGGRSVSAAECIAIALRENPDALTSEYDVREAEATRAGVRGQYGPKLHADAAIQQWDRPFTINLGTPYTIRNAFTWTVSATLTQPLSGLFAIYDKYKEDDLGVDVAALRRDAMRRQVALEVVQQYYRLVGAEELQDVAVSSVTQLEAQEKQAQSLFANGVIGKNDLLRADLALAGARQAVIQRRGQVAIARGQLASVMGGGSSRDAIEPIRFSGEPPPVEESTAESAEERAVAQRVEIRELDRGIVQAEHRLGFAKKLLFPTVNGVANYTHFEGSQFQQTNAAYAGVTASWDVWDWGTTASGISEADARLQRARVARRKIEDQVRLEARQAFVDASTAREAFGVARASVSQAEENYRIVLKKFDANAATSFDVVDAEALLTQARGQIQQALYDYLIARASLKVAMGEAMAEEGR